MGANPRLRSAIELLQTTAKGPALLRTAANAGVTIRIGTPPDKALAVFRSRTRTITIGNDVAASSARAQSAVLAHELQHVSDWTKVGPLWGNTFNCYETEASAFTTEAAVWRELPATPPGDSIESHVESIARGVESGQPRFWIGLAGDYVDECVG